MKPPTVVSLLCHDDNFTTVKFFRSYISTSLKASPNSGCNCRISCRLVGELRSWRGCLMASYTLSVYCLKYWIKTHAKIYISVIIQWRTENNARENSTQSAEGRLLSVLCFLPGAMRVVHVTSNMVYVQGNAYSMQTQCRMSLCCQVHGFTAD